MLARGALVLAVLAALFGAPSQALAAVNNLSAPQASPGSGSTSTAFTFTVAYNGGHPATSVTASVAGRVLAMSRVNGSALSGTWSASSPLPAGTWQVTFSAVAERGNSPSIGGPTVTVGSAATPAPVATTKPPPKPPPTAAPTPVAAPSTSSGGNAPTTMATPKPITANPAPGSGGTVQPADEGDDGDTSPAGGDPAGTDGAAGDDPEPDGADGAPAPDDTEDGADGVPVASPGTTDAESLRDDAPAGSTTTTADDGVAIPAKDGLLNAVLLIGLSGVAAVALIGAAMMLAARRRGRSAATPAAVGVEIASAPAEPRMLRQARVRMTDDPILAALGIGNEDDDRRRARRKAGQTGHGPGERPNVGRR